MSIARPTDSKIAVSYHDKTPSTILFLEDERAFLIEHVVAPLPDFDSLAPNEAAYRKQLCEKIRCGSSISLGETVYLEEVTRENYVAAQYLHLNVVRAQIHDKTLAAMGSKRRGA